MAAFVRAGRRVVYALGATCTGAAASVSCIPSRSLCSCRQTAHASLAIPGSLLQLSVDFHRMGKHGLAKGVYAMVERDPLKSSLVSTVLSTAMWMRGGPLHTVYYKFFSDTPSQASDVTAHNVESCLRRAGKLGDDTHISGIEVETFGLQEDGKPKGLVSEIVRVTCTFEGSTPIAVPSTFLIKLAPSEFGMRMFGRLLMFKNESNFYLKGLGPYGGLRVPDLYHAEYNKVTGEVAIFLEDLSPLTPTDQGTGMSTEDTKLVLTKLAGFHAAYWGLDGSSTTPDLSEAVGVDNPTTLNLFADFFAKSAPKFCPEISKAVDMEFTPEFQSLVMDTILPNVKSYTDSKWMTDGRPQTLLHGDARCENIFMTEDSAGNRDAIFIDPQNSLRGPAGCDLCYGIMFNYGDDLTEEMEVEFIEHYYQTLIAAKPGLQYSFVECCHDYICGLTATVYKFIIAGGDGADSFGRNPEVFRNFFQRMESTSLRWNMKGFFEQGCARAAKVAEGGNAQMTDAERLEVLPKFVQDYCRGRAGERATSPIQRTGRTPAEASQTWLSWLGLA